MIALLIIFNAAMGFMVGGLVGGYIERRNWNKLIQSGRLPKPSPKASPRGTGWYEH